MNSKKFTKALLVSVGLGALLVGPQAFAATGHGVGTTDNNISAGGVGAGFEAVEGTAAKAESIGEFDIAPGKLTLDQVPNFFFKNDQNEAPSVFDVSQGRTVKLVDQAVSRDKALAGSGLDGSDAKKLVVSDYRGLDTAGWNLSVAVAPFKLDDAHTISGVTLSLKTNVTARGVGEAGSDLTDPQAVSIEATGSAVPVLTAAPKSGTLTNNFYFDGTTTLTFAKQAAQAGNYQSKITWSLENVPPAKN